MPNTQPIEKQARGDGSALDVHSVFRTIQGEGPFSGTPAVFLRLAGCNLQCPLCDTDYTQNRKSMRVDDVLDAVVDALLGAGNPWPSMQGGRSLVVVTGGEPYRQNLTQLLPALLAAGYFVQIESNGTMDPQLSPHSYQLPSQVSKRRGLFLVVSPKSGKVNARAMQAACCFKYVLSHDSVDDLDGLPTTALGHTANPRLARPARDMPIYLQPADHKDAATNELNRAAVLHSCMWHGYIAQEQMHKHWNLE